MSRFRIPGGRRLLLVPPIAVGVAVVAWLGRSNEGLREIEAVERSTAVRVIEARVTDVVPRVIGYGVAEPARIWQVVTQVAGRVVEKSERAESGDLLPEGTIFARIDPQTYELTVRQTRANIAKLEADLTELATNETNLERTLEIERRALEAYDRELQRKRELVENKVVAQSEVDLEESRYLQQLVRVGELENETNLLPARRQALEAQKLADEARLASAELDLSYTNIEVPYACRLVRVDFEEAQYVGIGTVLAEAHGIEKVEVPARIPVARMRHLISNLPQGAALLTEILKGDLIDQLGMTARIKMRSGDFHTSWDARVERVSATLDPETRTMGVVVTVDEPYVKAIPGQRPPLVQGMFVEVELRGPAKPGLVIVPRSAVHAGLLYVAVNGRLERREAQIAFPMQDFVCLSAGLADGELLVVSDPIPAIDGMRLSTTLDVELAARIELVAAGEADIR